jgi:hypothetical protein
MAPYANESETAHMPPPGVPSQKQRCCFESFFRCALVRASDQEGWFVLFVGIRVPGETPPVFVSEVANPAEMNRGIPQPFDPLTTFLTGRWTAFTRHVGFHVCVDIAESAVETDVDLGKLSGVVLGSVIENTPLRTCSNAGRDALAARGL